MSRTSERLSRLKMYPMSTVSLLAYCFPTSPLCSATQQHLLTTSYTDQLSHLAPLACLGVPSPVHQDDQFEARCVVHTRKSCLHREQICSDLIDCSRHSIRHGSLSMYC